jgi:hypothetical protein
LDEGNEGNDIFEWFWGLGVGASTALPQAQDRLLSMTDFEIEISDLNFEFAKSIYNYS